MVGMSWTGMHANTQIPKVLGFKRIADVDRMHRGMGSPVFLANGSGEPFGIVRRNSVSEHFNPVDDFSRMITSIEGTEDL